MSKDTQDKLIDAIKLLALVGASIGAFALGASDLALFIAGGALGHAVPSQRRTVTQ